MTDTEAALSFDLAIAEASLHALTERLARDGHLRVENVLMPETAKALAHEVSTTQLWNRSFRQGKVEREIHAEELLHLSPAQLKAIERFALAGPDNGFFFLHDTVRIADSSEERLGRGMLVDRLVEGINQERNLDILRRIIGDPTIKYYSADANRYNPGDFCGLHNDLTEEKRRVVAVIFYLSERWVANWGGLLMFHDDHGDICRALTPHFNAMHILKVPQPHSVSQVAQLAPFPRYSVAGWLYSE